MTVRGWLIALVLFVVGGGCTSTGGSGSQTNWVKCRSDAECDPKLVCVASRCQRAPGTTDARAPEPVDARVGEPVDARVHDPIDARNGGTIDLKRSSLDRAPTSVAEAGAIDDLVSGNTELGFALYGRVSQSPGNIVFSPYSITSAMAMAWAGAKGKTAEEIATVFHFGDPAATHAAMNALDQRLRAQESQLVLQVANALWILPSRTPLGPYLDTLARYYGAGVGLVDFGNAQAAADTIDAWVSANTAGTIPRLLQPGDLPPGTTSVLTNALYFKARWASQFDKIATTDAPFKVSPSNTVSVKMMSDIVTARYGETTDYQAAALPYRSQAGHAYEMLVILPAGDLAAFEATFDAKALATLLSALELQYVDFAMPRFQLRSDLHLRADLSALGMPTAFGDADFSGVSEPPPGNVDDVVHQGFISVDESGTEASAATAVVFRDSSASSFDVPPPVLRLDRPFLAIVRDAGTGTVLFMARIAQP